MSLRLLSSTSFIAVLIIILTIATKCEITSAANILIIVQFPGKSHWIMFDKLGKVLVDRGHQVDVVTHFPSKETIKGYNNIDIRGTAKIVTNNTTLTELDVPFTDILYLTFAGYGVSICENTFDSPKIQELLSNPPRKYDMVITEQFSSDCMLGWAWKFDAISVTMTTSELLPWATDRFGLPDNPAYIHNYFSVYEKELTLYGRIMNIWIYWKSKFLYKIWSENPSNEVAKKFFGQNMPDLDILSRNISLFLVNRHFSINGVRPSLPNVVDVAGLHLNKPKPLDKNFSTLLNIDQEKGIILFSMGSVMRTETFPTDTLQSIFDTFAELPYRIIWRGNRSEFSQKSYSLPTNIHFVTWLPQLDILCDSRVKLFISHGGQMGGQEAAYCGIPILGIPLFADQFLNLKRAEAFGYAKTLNIKSFKKHDFSEAIKAMLFDKRYLQNAKLVSQLFRDRPLTAVESATYWIEYVLKYKNIPQLYNVAKDLPWYQLYSFDILVIFFSLFTVSIYSIKYLSQFLLKSQNYKLKSS